MSRHFILFIIALGFSGLSTEAAADNIGVGMPDNEPTYQATSTGPSAADDIGVGMDNDAWYVWLFEWFEPGDSQ